MTMTLRSLVLFSGVDATGPGERSIWDALAALEARGVISGALSGRLRLLIESNMRFRMLQRFAELLAVSIVISCFSIFSF